MFSLKGPGTTSQLPSNRCLGALPALAIPAGFCTMRHLAVAEPQSSAAGTVRREGGTGDEGKIGNNLLPLSCSNRLTGFMKRVEFKLFARENEQALTEVSPDDL